MIPSEEVNTSLTVVFQLDAEKSHHFNRHILPFFPMFRARVDFDRLITDINASSSEAAKNLCSRQLAKFKNLHLLTVESLPELLLKFSGDHEIQLMIVNGENNYPFV